MHWPSFALCFLLLGLPLGAQEKSTGPTITGVAGIRLLATDPEKSREFYGKELGLRECRSGAALCFTVNALQMIELDHLGRDNRLDRLVSVAFRTRDVAKLRQHLVSQGIQSGDLVTRALGGRAVDILDPEGHAVEFVEYEPGTTLETRTDHDMQVSRQIIHVGYVVKNREVMDRLYREILGFHIYWQGGRAETEMNWVDMQVSDRHGTDWLEYMLGVSPDASHKTLGVMNHIALGVPDIRKAQEQLIKNGWKGGEEPKIGRDGKWQLNLYDPDETRVELMEFKPTKEPCCSPYTGPHPGPR